MTIPFNRIQKVGDKIGYKDRAHGLNQTRQRIISGMPIIQINITKAQSVAILAISDTAVGNVISLLRQNGFIKRIGENKNGYRGVLA